LLAQAALGYEQLLKDYPEQTNWCAQSLRSLGGVRAAQGHTNDAVKILAEVGQKYRTQDWEVIQAWKAAGDLLQEAGRPAEARQFYRQIVERFDSTNSSQVIQIIVRAARKQM
jgi:predicted negative regulator of RcsB-dependent stress response